MCTEEGKTEGEEKKEDRRLTAEGSGISKRLWSKLRWKRRLN